MMSLCVPSAEISVPVSGELIALNIEMIIGEHLENKEVAFYCVTFIDNMMVWAKKEEDPSYASGPGTRAG